MVGLLCCFDDDLCRHVLRNPCLFVATIEYDDLMTDSMCRLYNSAFNFAQGSSQQSNFVTLYHDLYNFLTINRLTLTLCQGLQCRYQAQKESDKRMYLIGEFSKIAQVSGRQLRHYDELGLFVPLLQLYHRSSTVGIGIADESGKSLDSR